MSSKVVSKEDQYWLEVTKDLFSPRGDGIKVGLDNRLHDGQFTMVKLKRWRPYTRMVSIH
jgi:hypothetical protein